jgi:hypothetical protein
VAVRGWPAVLFPNRWVQCFACPYSGNAMGRSCSASLNQQPLSRALVRAALSGNTLQPSLKLEKDGSTELECVQLRNVEQLASWSEWLGAFSRRQS